MSFLYIAKWTEWVHVKTINLNRGGFKAAGGAAPCEKSAPLWPQRPEVKLMTQVYCQIM